MVVGFSKFSGISTFSGNPISSGISKFSTSSQLVLTIGFPIFSGSRTPLMFKCTLSCTKTHENARNHPFSYDFDRIQISLINNAGSTHSEFLLEALNAHPLIKRLGRNSPPATQKRQKQAATILHRVNAYERRRCRKRTKPNDPMAGIKMAIKFCISLSLSLSLSLSFAADGIYSHRDHEIYHRWRHTVTTGVKSSTKKEVTRIEERGARERGLNTVGTSASSRVSPLFVFSLVVLAIATHYLSLHDALSRRVCISIVWFAGTRCAVLQTVIRDATVDSSPACFRRFAILIVAENTASLGNRFDSPTLFRRPLPCNSVYLFQLNSSGWNNNQKIFEKYPSLGFWETFAWGYAREKKYRRNQWRVSISKWINSIFLKDNAQIWRGKSECLQTYLTFNTVRRWRVKHKKAQIDTKFHLNYILYSRETNDTFERTYT